MASPSKNPEFAAGDVVTWWVDKPQKRGAPKRLMFYGTVRYQQGPYVRVEMAGPPRRELNVLAADLKMAKG